MSNTNGRIGGVHMLATGTGGAESIHTNIRLINRHLFHLIGLSHHRYRTGRSVNASLRFGFRHPLYPMRTRLKLECSVDISPADPADNFLVTAVLARVFTEYLDLPAPLFAIAAIHAK